MDNETILKRAQESVARLKSMNCTTQEMLQATALCHSLLRELEAKRISPRVAAFTAMLLLSALDLGGLE